MDGHDPADASQASMDATDDRSVLFVCSGNTCRSPLAAEAARAMGITAWSAGLAASPGEPATTGAVAAGRRIGLDLSAHRSRRLTAADIATAQLVLAMTDAQAAAVVDRWPQAAGKVCRLDRSADVEDPYGGDEAVYDAIAAHLVDTVRRRFRPVR